MVPVAFPDTFAVSCTLDGTFGELEVAVSATERVGLSEILTEQVELAPELVTFTDLVPIAENLVVKDEPLPEAGVPPVAVQAKVLPLPEDEKLRSSPV
jgi:hypothetical protein